MKIKAKAKIDNQILDCLGAIEIHFKTNFQVYVTWHLCSNDMLIALVSENFFQSEKLYNESELVNRIIKKIERYRIGRKKVFEDVVISS